MFLNRSSTEKGQAVILLALAVVALLGFTALAIDVGTMYSSRRSMQNAADAAAYAGASQVSQAIKSETSATWKCSTLTPKYNYWVDAATAAANQAINNNFSVEPSTADVGSLVGNTLTVRYGIADKNGLEITCDQNSDPFVDVHVELTQPVQTAFMHFVNKGLAVNTVEAVVRVRPKESYADGASIVALKTSCDNTQDNGGIHFDGKVKIDADGDIISNACMDKNGTAGKVTATGHKITYVTELTPKTPKADDFDPMPAKASTTVKINYQRLDNQVKAACQKLGNYSTPVNNTSPTGPGNYTGLDVGGSLTLSEGLYCIQGPVNIKGTLTGNNVTIYVPEAPSGAKWDFKIQAGAKVTLVAPPLGCEDNDTCHKAIGGLAIFYMPKDDTKNTVEINGHPNSTFNGSIIAPQTMIDIGGTSDADVIQSQIIGETIKTHGNGTLDVVYQKDLSYSPPMYLNLNR